MAQESIKIGVVLRPNTPSLRHIYETFHATAKKHKIQTQIEQKSAKMIGLDSSLDFNALCESSDILASIGGDGTLISLIRKSIDYSKPIFGVNMGRLGFLTALQMDSLDIFLSNLAKNNYAISSNILLHGELFSPQGAKKSNLCCVNEFLITKKNISGMIAINATVDGKYFNTYRSDGLIIGTPMGSSAYNISAGGPIVYPHNRNVLLTPVCAHSLTQKPLVLGDEFSFDFTISEGVADIIIDGQEIINFGANDKFRVSVLDKTARLIYSANRDYFEVLREKFGWGNQGKSQNFRESFLESNNFSNEIQDD